VERAAGPAPLGAIVRVVGAAATPRQLALRAGICRIGAAPDVDMMIEDETVSRQHVELELVPEGVAVRDLGSRNGTFYLGQRVHTMVLALGSSIALGKAEVRIDADLAALDKGAAEAPARYGDLVGVSPAMQRLFAALTRLEGSLVNILVEGESGTGK